MQSAKIKTLPRGEYVKLRDSETAPVWVKGEYCRSSKMYEFYKFDDVNHTVYRKGDSLVFVGFTF